MIKILFFAKYREQFGAPSLELSAVNLPTVGSLVRQLQEHFPAQCRFLADQNLIIAVNQEVSTLQSAIKSGDEVAFFPPVTGG